MSRNLTPLMLLLLAGLVPICLGGCASTPGGQSNETSSLIASLEAADHVVTDADADGAAPADADGAVDDGIDAASSPDGVPTAAVHQPTVTERKHETGFKLDARAWFAMVGPGQEDVIDKDTFLLPMYGATLTWSPAALPDWGFLLTYLTGSGKGDIRVRDGQEFEGDLDTDRTDVELLARYSIPNYDAYVFAGLRWVDYQEDASWSIWENKNSNEVWMFELGLGTATNISEDGAHRLFGNLVLGIGQVRWDWSSNRWPEENDSGKKTEYSFDTNFGYQWAFSDSWDFSLRYRVFLMTGENDFGMDTFNIFHGPEITLGFRF